MYTECPKTEALGENLIPGTFQGNVGRVKIFLKYIAIRNISLLRQCFWNSFQKHVPVRLFVRVSFSLDPV